MQGVAPKELRISKAVPFRGVRSERSACMRVGLPGYECHTELEFLDEDSAEQLGLPKSTRFAVHKCVKPKSYEGKFVPVQSPLEASKVAKEFCNCTREESETTRRKCARHG